MTLACLFVGHRYSMQRLPGVYGVPSWHLLCDRCGRKKRIAR